ncbi:RND transporter [Methylobacterium sp. DM1]|uniref:Efflux transporter, RND family, MFP subunit n=1 Tax=Methylorubrum populi (strain ATCC BAA-705 / NCIMB 13946 / BJ001) TaxID=441620 RepID=B1ZJE6_METPB|nr:MULTISPECIES: HlyD family efflux transporter periplasmic adaptor subunit [Methylorubrum]ACB80049.1 efflux transporter, RND family, MFP subunit [Methylorubrum populi BJ001]AWI88738.1 RND transporter [Methylobacterium sp. DM1]MBI1691969.1 HlyD family efflux transporter periplasmic adaptor subunit [Methylorubrum sp. DB1722]
MTFFKTDAHARPRGRAAGLAMLILATGLAAPALAGGGDDHSHGPAPAAAAAEGTPRVAMQSDLYQVVGILKGDRLTLYVDRSEDNAPVTGATVSVTVEGEAVPAVANADGTYAVSSPHLAEPGSNDLVIQVAGPDGEDLLIGSLVVAGPSRPAAQAEAPHPHAGMPLLAHLKERLGQAEPARAWALAVFAVGLALGLALRSRRMRPAAFVAGAVLVVALTGTAFAHGGEDHDHDAPAATPGSNTPQRLPDGSVFVPKPSQRILEVRTTTAKLTEVEGATRLIGKVIPDPNRGGLVQSIGGGRVIAPEAGMPRLGQAVRKGEVLARVERPIIQADQAIVVEKVGEIEQQIGLAEAKLARARKLVASGAGTAISVSDLEIELEGMRRRRAAVSDIRTTPETLTAPADGVIATTRVAAGQVVQPQDVLFQVVDPGSLWVEALSFEDAPTGTKTSAVTADGTTLTLQAKGVSRALQQQATVLQFAVVDPPAGLKVGQPVTVLAATGASAAGIVLPRNAVVRGTGGEAMVWRHAAPERFEPRQVRVEPVDATRVVVRAGVKEGERVVVRGADLINQIR